MIRTLAAMTYPLVGWVDVSLAIKGSLLVLVGLAAARTTRRASAAMRHLILAATFVGSLTLPFVLALLPDGVVIEVPVAGLPQPPAVPTATPAAAAKTAAVRVATGNGDVGSDTVGHLTSGGLIRPMWAAGMLVIVASLGGALWQVARIRRSAIPWVTGRERVRTLAAEAGIHRSVDVLFHERIVAPLTAGFFYPAILLPFDAPQWSEHDLRRALVHELEHVRRGDWAIQLIAHIACALYWFTPLVWIARRQLCLEAERASDDAVLANADGSEYADQLVQLAQRLSKATPQSALAMARRSDLSARVSAILDAAQRRGRTGVGMTVVALSVMVAAVIGIAPLRAVAVSQDRDTSTEANLLEQAKASIRATESQSQRHPGALDRALYEAAQEGDLNAIATLLDAGANIDVAIGGEGSPLIGAARQRQLEAARLLLDRGADPNMPVRGDGSPLIIAAREGDIRVVALLLERGASVDQVVPDDENALIQASGHGQLPVVRLLVARGADVNARVWAPHGRDRTSGTWRTPLSQAREGNHVSVAKFLVSVGARE